MLVHSLYAEPNVENLDKCESKKIKIVSREKTCFLNFQKTQKVRFFNPQGFSPCSGVKPHLDIPKSRQTILPDFSKTQEKVS